MEDPPSPTPLPAPTASGAPQAGRASGIYSGIHSGPRPGLDWLRLLLEFVIVVVGISLSFFLQDLREEHSMRAEEDRFLAGFARDFRADLEVLRSREALLASMSTGLRSTMDSKQREELTDKDLDRIMDAGLTYVAFAPSMATYLELRQTGASKLIRDKKLLGKIIRLYETDYALATEWDRINRDLVLQRMFPYVEEFGPGVDGRLDGSYASGYHSVFLALEHEQWFKNLLSTNAMFKDAQNSVYVRLAEKIEGMLPLLN